MTMPAGQVDCAAMMVDGVVEFGVTSGFDGYDWVLSWRKVETRC